MDQSIIAFDESRFDYLPDSHRDGGLRYSGSIFDDNGSEWESGQSYVKNEPTPTADRQDAALVSFDDGEVFTNLDDFPAQARGFTGLRLAHIGSNPGSVETYYAHTWSALDFGRWTGVLGDLTVNLPGVSVSLAIPTGVDSWNDSKTFYKG